MPRHRQDPGTSDHRGRGRCPSRPVPERARGEEGKSGLQAWIECPCRTVDQPIGKVQDFTVATDQQGAGDLPPRVAERGADSRSRSAAIEAMTAVRISGGTSTLSSCATVWSVSPSAAGTATSSAEACIQNPSSRPRTRPTVTRSSTRRSSNAGDGSRRASARSCRDLAVQLY